MDFSAALNRIDDHGNQMWVEPSTGVVSLLLKSPGARTTRNIGVVGVTERGTVYYDKSVKEENRFRKTDSWGLNWAIIEVLPAEAVVRLRSAAHTYLIKAGEARLCGGFLWFKSQGFERQWFVPISSFSVS